MFSFGDYTIDVQRFELRRGGEFVHLEPQVFDVLRYLVENAQRVVAKEELLDAVWGDRFISETALTTRIKEARRALADDGCAQQWIRTVRGRGYEFVGQVSVASPPPNGGPPSDPPSAVSFCRGADGVRVAFAELGQGPPLVKAANWMTHIGHDTSSPVWRHWLAALSQGHRLIRYDERGCGLSQWDVESFTFADWVADLETVVDAAGLKSFPLLGISQGAAVAIAYAARHPERVERLVLIGGYAVGRAARALTEQEQAAADLDVRLAEVGWGGSDPAFRRVFAMQFFPDGPVEVWQAFDELQRQTTSAENAARFLRAFGAVDVRDVAPRVRCPTIILHSRDEIRVPFQCALELAELVPGSALVPLPSRNHLLTADEPAWPVLLDELGRFC